MKPVIVIQGASGMDEVPRLNELIGQAELRFAMSVEELRAALPGAEVMLGWNFRAANLSAAWDGASNLRWIHWTGAGVDATLFPELIASEIQLTNARGIFNVPMAEWVLGIIISFAKQFPQTLAYQAQAEWNPRFTELVTGKKALIVGAGSIGRTVGRLLRAAGMEVEAIGRSARNADPDFGRVYAVDELHARLSSADYVILITPLTQQTRNLFGTVEFASMPRHARFINIGRGALVVEAELLAALQQGEIAGAALDVFVDEPLSPHSPLWQAPNCLVSPHMSGDCIEFEHALSDQFMRNWERYLAGEPLLNIVDKELGFVVSTGGSPESG